MKEKAKRINSIFLLWVSMLIQTCSIQIQASVSVQNASGQTQSKPQEWGQEGVCETQILKGMGRSMFHCKILKNWDKNRLRKELYIVEIIVHPFMAQLPQKPHITGGIFQRISINSEWSQRNENWISSLTTVILPQSSIWQKLHSIKLIIFLPSF